MSSRCVCEIQLLQVFTSRWCQMFSSKLRLFLNWTLCLPLRSWAAASSSVCPSTWKSTIKETWWESVYYGSVMWSPVTSSRNFLSQLLLKFSRSQLLIVVFCPQLTDESFPGIDLLIAIGVIIMVLGFLGCCGAIKENRCMLLIVRIVTSD